MKSLGNCPIFLYPSKNVQYQDWRHYNGTQPWSVTDDFPVKRKGWRQAVDCDEFEGLRNQKDTQQKYYAEQTAKPDKELCGGR